MKEQDKFAILMSFACLISALFMVGVAVLIVLNDGPLNIVNSTLAGIEICIAATSVQCLFLLLLSWVYKPNDYRSTQSLSSQVLNLIKSIGVLFLGSLVFHAIAVFFGAPFFESVSKTYHFAMLLTVQVCLPFCLFVGSDLDACLKVFTTNSCDGPLELVVFFCSIGALLGAWLGAIPIPLDWDRPWQEWPITCVTGASLGYAGGLLLSSVYIPRQHTASNKSKFF